MDTKALAKSKRAHSQQHKNKSHSYQKSKAPVVASDNAGSKEKQPGKQVGSETHQSRLTSRLPSNWDRYEDEFDLDSENPFSQASAIIVPKSKGADYHHLIAQAQSETKSHSYSYSDTFSSFDDVMPGGFFRALGSMLQVKGEGILSWDEDDNFIVEDKTTALQEASFLSLNLNALAEQLAKVDLSQRLFIEADLLPPEQGAEGSVASGNLEDGQMQTKHESEIIANISKDIENALDDFSEGEEDSTAHVIEAATNISVNIAKDDLNYSQFDKQTKAFEPIEWFNENSVVVSQNRPKFEATAAEAELDALLDSFSESKLLESSGSKSADAFSASQPARTSALPQSNLSQTASSVAAGFDVLDDLLEETSNLTKRNQLLRKEPDLSKTASGTAGFEDVLDDLLDETANLMGQNGLSVSQDVTVIPDETQSSSSQSVAKLDDFDSWLATI